MSEDLISAAAVERRFVEFEHRDLRPGLDRLREVTQEWPRMNRDEAVDGMLRVVNWAEHEVLPHLAWERTWWYPELGRQAGSPLATNLVQFLGHHLQERIAALSVEGRVLTVDHSADERAEAGLALAALYAELVLHLDVAAHLLDPGVNGQVRADLNTRPLTISTTAR